MEVLSSPEKRRQFDSVDHEVDVDEPDAKETTPENFCELWGPVFELEGRFSLKGPSPPLGTSDSPYEDVEAFYDFWHRFSSWRTFEMLDKEGNEGSDRCVFLPWTRSALCSTR